MAVKVGQVSVPSGSGSQATTGVGFQPVAVLFWSIEINQGNPSNFLGCATGASNQWACWTGMDDQASTYDRRYQEIRNDKCLYILASPNFTTEQCAASLTSLDSDGFTLNFSTGGNSEVVAYMAIGGNNISAAHAGTFTLGSSTGTTGITGVGFEPNALVVAHTGNATVNSQGNGMVWATGFSDGTNHYSSAAFVPAGGGLAGDYIHRTDSIACFYINSTVALGAYRLELDSFDSDGFTVDVADAWVANIVHGYLAIESVAAAVGNGVQPDSTGVQSFSTPGFEPAGVMFGWNGVDTPSTTGAVTGSAGTPLRPGFGAMDGVSGLNDQPAYSISLIHRTSAPFGSYVPDAYMSGGFAINMIGRGSQVDPFAHEIQGNAEWESFSQGGFEIDWTDVTSGADRAFGWLALPGDLPIDWVPHIYRRVLVN